MTVPRIDHSGSWPAAIVFHCMKSNRLSLSLPTLFWSRNDRFREVAKRDRGLSWLSADVEVPRSSGRSQKTKGAVASPPRGRAARMSMLRQLNLVWRLAPTRFVGRRLARNRAHPPVDLTTGKYSQKRRADLFPLVD